MKLSSEKGFSLVEILIAITILSIFVTSFLTSQGNIVGSSTLMRKEIILKNLCLRKMNEVLIHPPELKESLTLKPEKGTFKDENLPEYEYEIIYKRMIIPDFTKIIGHQDDADDSSTKQLQQKVMKVIQKNFKEMVWQVSVTVNEIGTSFPYTLTNIIINKNASVKIDL